MRRSFPQSDQRLDDMVGADVVRCPEAGEALVLPGGDSLRSDE
jgi:hypothetical protein